MQGRGGFVQSGLWAVVRILEEEQAQRTRHSLQPEPFWLVHISSIDNDKVEYKHLSRPIITDKL
jgi:hypothetical protein